MKKQIKPALRKNKSGSDDLKKIPDSPDAITNTLPIAGTEEEGSAKRDFPIVGIGASAGGLKAFEAFFSGMPADTDGFGNLTAGPGMAFILVQHLAPDHKSILAELISSFTRMQVFEVRDGMEVKINCVYIIAPNRDMALLNGALQLMEPTERRGQRLPIDFFFSSLAQDQRERAIAIILSGTGSDGTLGVRAIKGEGGMVIVQNPASTEFVGMPRSAIATGMVDYELPPAEMPAKIIAYVAHAFGNFKQPDTIIATKAENALKKIFVLLRAQTGHDFSLYKPSNIFCRIQRRMAVQQIDTMEMYVKYLQNDPNEITALFHDMLIGVTNFFRDPKAFTVLEKQIIPRLFEGKSAGDAIRVWATGCSTGEEAYSLAILLIEQQEALKQSFQIRVFATDIDSRAIATARVGLYPAGIARNVSRDRLMRFFTIEPGGGAYRIHKNIRDMMIFAEHSVIKDPPFSKIDLISCRNLLIYLGGDLQEQLIPMFHYSLNSGGFLFLSTSETVGEFTGLFGVEDRDAKLYQRKESIDVAYPERHKQRGFSGMVLPPAMLATTAIREVSPLVIEKTNGPKNLSPRELTERALMRIAPAAALVNGNGSIIYLQGRTGLYLEPAQGEPGSSNILKMAREGLRDHLNIDLRKAVRTKEIVHSQGLLVQTAGGQIAVNLTVHPVIADPFGETQGRPAASPASVQYLVILEEAAVSPGKAGKRQADKKAGVESPKTMKGDDAKARIAALQLALRVKEEYIQTSNEELEYSTEELKFVNEEMQSVNEKLQSSNEELETSKEELQSVNEALLTVNTEMQTKVADLSRANNDMNNLLAGTGIGTIFVDQALTIQRFTPPVTQIMNMILSDLGRPVSHIASNLRDYDQLSADVKTVLDTLIPKEIEVQTTEGKWYLMRILPYRTTNNVIEGAVITFVEITELKQMHVSIIELEKVQAEMQASEERFRSLVSVTAQIVWITDAVGNVTGDMPSWRAYTGQTVEQVRSEGWAEALHPEDLQQALAVWQRALESHSLYEVEYRMRRHDGQYRLFAARGTPLRSADGSVCEWVGYCADITERKRTEEALRESREKYSTIFDQSPIAIEFYNSDGGLISVNSACINLFGVVNRNEISGFKLFEDPNISTDIKAKLLNMENVRFEAEFNFEEVKRLNLYQTTCSGIKILDWSISPLTNGNVVVGYIEQIQDITERKQLEDELKRSLQKAKTLLRLAVTTRDSQDALTVQDLDGRIIAIIAWNPAALRMYGWSEVEALDMDVLDRIPEGRREEALARLHRLSQSEKIEPYRTQRLAKDGRIVEIWMTATALLNETGQVYAISTMEREDIISTRK